MLFLFHTLLLILVMLWLVPLLTDRGVQVQGGLLRAGLVLLLVSVCDSLLWIGLTGLTLFTNLLLNFLTLGLVALLVRGGAYLVVGRVFSRSLYVRDYGAAFVAALAMSIASWGIWHFVH